MPYSIQQVRDLVIRNLSPDCNPDGINITGNPANNEMAVVYNQIKLFETICDACKGTKIFNWYSLETILGLNQIVINEDGGMVYNIICNDCHNWGCGNVGSILSFLKDNRRRRYSRIDRIVLSV